MGRSRGPRTSAVGHVADIGRGWADDGNGSGCVSPLFKFIAGKRPVEFRFPEAASRQCVLTTRSGAQIC